MAKSKPGLPITAVANTESVLTSAIEAFLELAATNARALWVRSLLWRVTSLVIDVIKCCLRLLTKLEYRLMVVESRQQMPWAAQLGSSNVDAS